MRVVPRLTPGELIAAELIGAGVGGLAAVLGTPPTSALAAGVLVVIALLIPVGSRPAIGWLALFARVPRSRAHQIPRPADTPGGLGISWSGLECAAVIELVPRPSLTFLTRRGAAPVESLPLGTIAKSLSQHDIHLSGIDVVSHAKRVQTRAASVLRQLVGPLPAVPNRSVWIVLRLDAREGCVDRRGGGQPGAVAALRTATDRIVHLLAVRGLRARTLSAADIDVVATAIGGSARTSRWSSVEVDDRTNVGYSAAALSPAALDRLASTPASATTTMLSLRPSDDSSEVAAAISWRLTAADNASGGRRADGCQLEHLIAHLPLAGPRTSALNYRAVTIADLAAFEIAPGGCGQLVGATADGRAVAVALFGPGTSVATVSGSPLFLRQIVFRAVATGARMVVRSERQDNWLSLAEAIATPAQLRVIGLDDPVPPGFDAIVTDGDIPPAYPGVTTIYASSDPTLVDGIDADVSLIQSGDTITVTARGRTVDVELVTIPAEREFIAGSSGVRVR